MNPKHWSDEELFARAKDLASAEERARLLAEACADDPAQRQRIEGLLGLEQNALKFFEAAVVERDGLEAPARPAGGQAGTSPLEGIGDRIGPFRLLKLIGEGGFARVFLAEQAEPVRREVALKILKPGMDSGEVLTRFELERQALALMNHPNLARLFDAGTTPHGRPYFAMELVPGEPITRFCAERQLTLRARLELFIPVCRAVQHAHQKGILHRDLKPANILASLVDAHPVAKVIDFGIAKALHGSLTSTTLFTRVGQFIGTPAYMSPEQLALEDHVDTRSDIYSLGCVLYELLSGRPPFNPERFKSATPSTTRLICEDPPRPSDALSVRVGGDSSGRGLVDASGLKRQLRGELDWIVMKAMQKDPNRRYDSASALADDIQHFLQEEPVLARPPEWSYRVSKFAQRHRVAVAAGITVVASLALGLQLAVAGLGQANKERDKAVTAESQAKGERDAAAAERLRAEAYLYAADMNLASYVLRDSNVGRARELLTRHIPRPGEPDLRGWEWRYLWRQCRSDELATLGRHVRYATRVAFSPDGKILASAGLDRKVKLWDVGSSREIRALELENPVSGLAFSADGKLMGTAEEGPQGATRLWNTASWEVKLTLNKESTKEVAFSRDGKWVAAAGEWFVKVWDIATGTQIAAIDTWHRGIHMGCDFSPDSKWLAYPDRNDGRIKLWNLQAKTNRIELSAGSSLIQCTALRFSPSGRQLIACLQTTNTTALAVWDMDCLQSAAPNPAQAQVLTNFLLLTNHVAWVSEICFSADEKVMMTGSADQKIKFWDTATWRETASLKGHDNEVWGLALSPDGRLLASSGKDNTVRLWSTEVRDSEPEVRAYPPGGGGPPGMHFASMRAVPCQVDNNPAIRVWDPVSGHFSPTFTPSNTNAWPAAASADLRLVALGLVDSNHIDLTVWDVDQKKTTADLGRGWGPGWGATRLGDAVVAFSPDARRLAAIADSEDIRVWEIAKGANPVDLCRSGDAFSCWCFSPDSNRLVTGHKSGAVCLWEASSGKLLLTLEEPGDAIYDVALAPDGQTLATSCLGRVQVWNLARRAKMADLGGALLGFRLVAFSPDGARLAACSGEGDIKIWELSHYQEVATLRGHKEWHERLGFTADGNVLISMGYESVHLWRAPSLLNQ